MYNRERNRQMQLELISKQQNGFTNIKTIPLHCVSANYEVKGRKFGYSRRISRLINPYRLGFKNKYVKTDSFKDRLILTLYTYKLFFIVRWLLAGKHFLKKKLK